jgi:N utilization substance protein A
VTEGFSSVEEVAYVPIGELAGIEGLNEEVAGELQERARGFIERQNAEFEARRQELGVADEVLELPGMTPHLAATLGEKGVKTLDDVGDLAGDELAEMVTPAVKIDQEQANAIIMAARAHWFEGEGQPGATPEAG